MPTIFTKQFGSIEFNEEDIFDFPQGLPGFENEKRFLCIERPAMRPLVFLQSPSNPDLCFITLPARTVDPGYELAISSSDLEVLSKVGEDSVASDLSCLAIVCMPRDGQPTVNLLGPVVLSRETRKGVQCIRDDSRYSVTTPLAPAAEDQTNKRSRAITAPNGVPEE